GGTAIVNIDTTNSRVGIGTTSPTETLHVQGNLKVSGTISGTLSGVSISAAQVSSGTFGANVGNGNFTFPADLYVTGKVGIGTTSPDTQLHLKVSSGDIALKLSTQASVISTISGPNNPSAASDDSSNGGSVAWTSPTNVYTSNDVYASATIPGGTDPDYYWTDYLKATGFGFSIPSSANILGIKVEVEAKASAASSIGLRALLVKAGTPVGNERGSLLTTSDVYYSLGGETDLWGTTWSYSDINNSNFGVVISAYNWDTLARTAYIDHIRITVYYTTTGNADWQIAVASTTGALLINPSFSSGKVAIGTTAPIATLDVNGTIKGQFLDYYTGTVSRSYTSGNGTTYLNTGKYYPDWFCALSTVDATELDTASEHAYCNVTLSSNQWVL
ncbi:MAG: hypothetical protein ACPLKV_00850, partial [Minisyncoccia bacterium]